MAKVKAKSTEANEFIVKPGVSAWDDVDGEDDDKWHELMQKHIAKKKANSNKKKPPKKRSRPKLKSLAIRFPWQKRS